MPRWNIGVPLDHGVGHATGASQHIFVEHPHGIHHVIIVRVDDVGAAVAVPRQMDLHHTVKRQCIQVLLGILPVIETADVDIVHVQQQVAAGLPCQLCNKFRFRNL